jgi:hypothetical protein
LAALDAHFVERNVPLQVLAGAIGVLTTVRATLPAHAPPLAPAAEEEARSVPIDPFIALLLGVLVAHDRLSALVPADEADAPETRPVDPGAAVDAFTAFRGLLR